MGPREHPGKFNLSKGKAREEGNQDRVKVEPQSRTTYNNFCFRVSYHTIWEGTSVALRDS